MSYWIIYSTDSFKHTDSFRMKQAVFSDLVNRSLHHGLVENNVEKNNVKYVNKSLKKL